MLDILGRPRSDSSGLTRRQWIHAGGAGVPGESLSNVESLSKVLAAEEAQSGPFAGHPLDIFA